MTDLKTASENVAVVCERHGEQAIAMQSFLTSQALTHARWYAPRDVDDVDRAVREDRIQRVVFSSMGDLLDALWDEEIAFDQWLARGTKVDFVDRSASGANDPMEAVFASWQRWRRTHRRRQIVAGVVLSVVAIAAAFAVLATGHQG